MTKRNNARDQRRKAGLQHPPARSSKIAKLDSNTYGVIASFLTNENKLSKDILSMAQVSRDFNAAVKHAWKWDYDYEKLKQELAYGKRDKLAEALPDVTLFASFFLFYLGMLFILTKRPFSQYQYDNNLTINDVLMDLYHGLIGMVSGFNLGLIMADIVKSSTKWRGIKPDFTHQKAIADSSLLAGMAASSCTGALLACGLYANKFHVQEMKNTAVFMERKLGRICF